MHLTEYKSIGAHWKKVMITDYQLISIEKNILDTFYEANGNYTCLNTCNPWTNNILKKAFIKTAIWTPFDSVILKNL
ncbi:MAG: DUF2459 domain-containing protein [Flavobacteriaceae bacterium]|nr:DUF2459 domain-containing protein [Flavobacteriaceae bacterium]